MLIRITFTLALLTSLVGFADDAVANGILLTGSGRSEPRATTHPVRLRDHTVRAKVTDLVAEVTVEQTFFNHSSRQLEGTYLFPLPDGATVSKFAMTMAGKMVAGEVVEAKRAKRIYEGIVRRQKDPGLLEYVGRGLFRARVFPIEAHKPLTIRLTFQLVLRDDGGTLEFRYPLATDRMNNAPVGSVSLEIGVTSSVDLKAIYSPSHRLDVAREGERAATIKFASRSKRQVRDFLLYVERNPESVGFSVLSQKAAGQDGTFMAVLAPPQKIAKGKRLPKDIVFVVDTSGSMAGQKIEQARKALTYGVHTLHAEDRFHVLAFSSGVRPFRDGLLAAADDVKKAAVDWIAQLRASGGTNMEDALRAALGSARADRQLNVVLITDGKPSIGESNGPALIKLVKAAAGNARIYTFGVGYDLDVNLLDGIADVTHGTRDYVAPREDIEVVTGRFFRKVQEPVFADVKLDLGKGVYDVYPRRIGDLFAGSQIVVFGRYRDAGARTIQLSGTSDGGPTTFARSITFVDQGGPDYLQRLWAHRKVAYLIDEIRMHGRNKEVVDEVIALATRHAIVTPYTSGLVVEDGEPVIRDEDITDHVETDNDLGSFGESEGLSDGPFEGPRRNGVIGIGGGAGGSFMGRGGGRDLGTGGGGRKKFDDAVDSALRWLAAHQSSNGGWETAAFERWCDGKRRPAQGRRDDHGQAIHDVGVTGLTLSAFLGAGYTNRGKHDFARAVGMGLRYLKNVQDPEGHFGPRGGKFALRGHAWAALAMVEAYGMTGSPIFKGSAQRALDYIAMARNPYGVWGADVKDGGQDAETTTWMALVCHAAQVVNRDAAARGKPLPLVLDGSVADDALAWAQSEAGATPAARAQRLLVETLLGSDPTSASILRRASEVAKGAPTATTMDPARWHHGTLAMFQVSGRLWDTWKRGIETGIVASQRTDTDACDRKGSWDPRGPWSAEGGRVYMTAMMTRCLEVFYAYDRRSGRSAPRPVDFTKLTEAQRARLSQRLKDLKERSTASAARGTRRTAGGQTFVLDRAARWVDQRWDGKKTPQRVETLSEGWFGLAGNPQVAKMLALGERVVFVLGEDVYETVPAK